MAGRRRPERRARSVDPDTARCSLLDPASLQSVLVLAQLSTSVSDDQIRLIIIALLVVAVLLALVTVWYFVKTSPSRRVRAARARREAATGRPAAGAATGAAAAGTAAAGQQPSSVPGDSFETIRADDIVEGADVDDEWDRLTAPEPRRSSSS